MSEVPTTFEMDGLFTQEDIDNRYFVMTQCRSCREWTKQDIRESDRGPCESCNETNFDLQSSKSLRTFNYLTDRKRKPK